MAAKLKELTLEKLKFGSDLNTKSPIREMLPVVLAWVYNQILLPAGEVTGV